jgi:hypothetical protein|tara:strand:- start:1678 stop:2358 length:681 start_codon:yes stop_codon:yes gene_type:complete
MPYRPEKACKKHGDRYLLLPKDDPNNTSLCAHPECMKATITQMAKRFHSTNTMVKMVRDYGYLDECVSFVVCRLLEEYQKAGKPPVINPQWLFYNLNKFIQGDLIKGVMPSTTVPSHWRKKVQFMEITDTVIEDLETSNEEDNRYSFRGDYAFQDKQLVTILTNEVGPVWVSFIMRDIGVGEAQKLLNLSPAKFKKEWKKHKERLQWLFRDWKETHGLNLEEFINE